MEKNGKIDKIIMTHSAEYSSQINMSVRLTDSPRDSPLSAETLSETAIADILRGWVQIILQKAPRPDSISDSNIY